MEGQVVPEGHSVAGGYRTDDRSQRDSTGGVILGPVREVQDVASAIDVSNHEPRHRRNVGPDWPARLPRVAVPMIKRSSGRRPSNEDDFALSYHRSCEATVCRELSPVDSTVNPSKMSPDLDGRAVSI